MEGDLANTPHDIESTFLEYYEEFLGTEVPSRMHVNSNIVQQGMVVSRLQREELITPTTDSKIRATIWAINGE